jgi:hypothetical protein
MILDCLSGLDTDQVPQTSFIMSFDSLSDECIIYIEAGRHLICPNNPRSVSEIKPERPNGTITLYQLSEMRRRERDDHRAWNSSARKYSSDTVVGLEFVPDLL